MLVGSGKMGQLLLSFKDLQKSELTAATGTLELGYTAIGKLSGQAVSSALLWSNCSHSSFHFSIRHLQCHTLQSNRSNKVPARVLLL